MAYNTRKRVRDAVDTEDTSPDGTDNPPSPAKRIRQEKPVEKSKVTTTRVRRKGSLQELPKMPLDIIDEVSYIVLILVYRVVSVMIAWFR